MNRIADNMTVLFAFVKANGGKYVFEDTYDFDQDIKGMEFKDFSAVVEYAKKWIRVRDLMAIRLACLCDLI